MSTEPVVDNWPLEQRSDTLTFTTPAFENAVDIIGVPNAGIFVESDVETFDVFVRINRVDRDGRSTNITDGVRRIPSRAMKNNVERVRFDLSPTAIRLQEGERLRVLIASGAHPRIARNLGQGTLAEQAWATEMQTANVFIHHNGVYPSNVSIPLADAASIAANPQH